MTNFPAGANMYPLLLAAVPRERIWGGRMLAQLMHKSLPGDAPIGETWEAWPGCTILQGKYAGKTLATLLETDARAVEGRAAAAGGLFPLLFKYLDARDHLSVQVHPDDAQAQTLEGEAFGKTEAWYVLHAEPGSALIHGFRKSTSAEEFAAALKVGTLAGTTRPAYLAGVLPAASTAMRGAGDPPLADLLSFVTVQSGDVVFLPAGTVHALGKGLVIAEIQQNSDLTYRLYDWDRRDATGKPRERHVETGLQVAKFGALHEHKVPRVIVPQPFGEQHFLVACRYFTWELLVVRQAARELPLEDTFHILAVLAGSAAITFGPAEEWTCEMRAGQTMLVPAALEHYGIVPLAAECSLLRMYVPSLRANVIEPLRRAGVEDVRIAQLGGPLAAHNDLLPLLRYAVNLPR